MWLQVSEYIINSPTEGPGHWVCKRHPSTHLLLPRRCASCWGRTALFLTLGCPSLCTNTSVWIGVWLGDRRVNSYCCLSLMAKFWVQLALACLSVSNSLCLLLCVWVSDFSSPLIKHLLSMKLCFCLPLCLNCCCPEILCLSDSHSVCLLFMSVSPCWVGGNISLSLSYSLTPLFSLPHLLDFDQNTTAAPLNGMTVPHPDTLLPFSLTAPSPPFSPDPKQPVVWPQSVWLYIDIAFKLRLATIRLTPYLYFT